jgi:membrane protein YdbS with pleckstrin-like domain
MIAEPSPPPPLPVPPPDEASMDQSLDEAPLQRVEPGYVQVIRARTLMAWLPFVVGAVVLDRTVLDASRLQGLLLVLVPLLAAFSVLFAPPRIWARLAYGLEPARLRVVRGWLWHVDTLVPLVRVQHLDVARGPFDKMFGTATLVVHTAGTHNSTVSLPGLSPERAAELSAIIREHIQADLD